MNATVEENAAAAPEAEKTKNGNRKFDDAQIKNIRALRALKDEDGKVIHTHASLAADFGTTPGMISGIVRNRTYKDPNYVPTNDGK